MAGLLVAFSLVSCVKDSAPVPVIPTNSVIQGNYKLLSISSSTETRNENNYQGENYVVNSQLDYSSLNNTGSLQFESGLLTMSNLGYNISDSIQYVYYQHDTVVKAEKIPFTDSVPATSLTVPFRVVSEDSLYFPKGSPMGALPTGAGAQVATGVRFYQNGDTLTIKTAFVNDSTLKINGSPVKVYQDSWFTSRFIKQ